MSKNGRFWGNVKAMKAMKLPFLITLVIALSGTPVCAQKLIGSRWDGVVVSANEATREITLNNLRGDKKQTFVGVLEPGYKQELKDGTFRELSMSEFKPGLRIRVSYRETSQNVAGNKVKVKLIHTLSPATAQFVTIDNDGLKFIWLQGVFATTDTQGEKGLIEKEFEKRMKARK